jgi:hypothetical protein
LHHARDVLLIDRAFAGIVGILRIDEADRLLAIAVARRCTAQCTPFFTIHLALLVVDRAYVIALSPRHVARGQRLAAGARGRVDLDRRLLCRRLVCATALALGLLVPVAGPVVTAKAKLAIMPLAAKRDNP